MIEDVTYNKKADQFVVTFDDGTVSFVPNEPNNRHYRKLKHWYKAQKKAPFKFEFVDLD